jgi:hypothetical protein
MFFLLGHESRRRCGYGFGVCFIENGWELGAGQEFA